MDQSLDLAIREISKVVLGKQNQVKLALTCLLCRGHLLIEDLPGMGKTSLAQAIASTLGLQFSRVQFTSDLLPADILGVNIFDSEAKRFVLHQGPVFSQILLADEINRASPKTQSALLEAMEEKQVSIDGETYSLPDPFFVIATQNPTHQSGTYPLPESQLDRFFMRIQLGFPDWQSEKTMLMELEEHTLDSINNVISSEAQTRLHQEVLKVNASSAIVEYILRLVTYTRESEDFPNPLSPRASKSLLLAAKAWALLAGRSYVLPEDVQAILPSVAEHRLRSAYSDSATSHVFSDLLLSRVDTLAA